MSALHDSKYGPIRTEPPIPVRSADWFAVLDNEYDGAPDSDNLHQIGRGRTESEAIADLLAMLEEERS